MTTETLNKQEQFFYDNGSYSYSGTQTPEQGHIESAKALANAESLAAERGLIFEWMQDDEPCIGCECGSDDCPCFTGEPHMVEVCELWNENHDDCIASLCGICEATSEYRRVIEAELALEALS